MLRQFLYTISTFAVAGGLMTYGPAMAADMGSKSEATDVASSMDSKADPAEPKALFDVERNCAKVGMVPRPTKNDKSDTSEPNPRFDAARDCISTKADMPPSGVTRDYDPGEGEKVPNRLKK